MILFEKVTKKYSRHTAVSNLDIEVPKGTTLALIGPSGCGKTTTLKMVNRLIAPSSGKILINGKDIAAMDVIALRRSMGFVIQHVGLFPHMTVRENIEIIAKAEKRKESDIAERTSTLMEMVGLEPEFLNRYPSQLSGGQQQRIGVARAFALDPEIILMDEPFSALDPVTRSSLQDELVNIQGQLHKTIMFVTHDMDEAIRIADLICIMQQGKLVQYDTPDNILRNPADDFVVEFIGKKRIMPSLEAVLAKDIMIERFITCAGTLSLSRCLDKMNTEQVDTMFVVMPHTNILCGVLNIEKIRREKDLSKPASSIMPETYVSASPDTPITDIMKDIRQFKLHCVPVITDNKKLVGLVTKNSLFATLSRYYIETQEVQDDFS